MKKYIFTLLILVGISSIAEVIISFPNPTARQLDALQYVADLRNAEALALDSNAVVWTKLDYATNVVFIDLQNKYLSTLDSYVSQHQASMAASTNKAALIQAIKEKAGQTLGDMTEDQLTRILAIVEE